MTEAVVLVTGASGFVGRHVLPALVGRGFHVHAVARQQRDGSLPSVSYHPVDLRDARAVTDLTDRVRPSHLLHLAWYVVPGRFWRAPENLDWVAASLLLYRAFVQNGGRHMVSVGSCAEYDWDFDVLDEVTTPCRPATLYGVAKHALHQVLAAAATQDGVRLSWARLFFMYGPHEAAPRLVPDVTRSLLRGEPVLCGDGEAMRDFMYVEDVASALATLLASDQAGPINIASGECVPLRDVIFELAEIVGRPELVRLNARPAVPGEPLKLAASVSILRDQLGFRPSHARSDGLAKTVNWWRAADGQ